MTASGGGADAGGGSEADAAAPTTSVPPAQSKRPNIGLPLFRYPGKEPDFVVIVAGIHTSEQSGVEVARWIIATLNARAKPTRLGAVIIPEVFPQDGIRARMKELQVSKDSWNKSNEFREFKDGNVLRYPNRHFPPPGFPLAALKRGVLLTVGGDERLDESRKAIPMLPQIRQVVELIEQVRPVRIVSIHGKHPPGQGIFVDSRYAVCVKDGFALENCKFDLAKDPAYPKETKEGVAKQFDSSRTKEGRDDDNLAKRLAEAVAVNDRTLVLGNHLDRVPQVHYHEKLKDKDKDVWELGYSLGDWGPVDVKPTSLGPGAEALAATTGAHLRAGGAGTLTELAAALAVGILAPSSGFRPGAPVFTIETYQNHESWAFDACGGQLWDPEKGQPLQDPLSGRAYQMPPKFHQGGPGRAKQLHGLAQAIVNVILDS